MSDVTASSTDIVREVIKSTLDVFSTILSPNNDATDEDNSTHTSIKDKLFDELINEVCGHVNDDLRNLWYVSCDCDENATEMTEEECIKEMKTYPMGWMNLFECLLTALMRIQGDPYLYVELDFPSDKPKKPLKEILSSPIHIPGDEPIVVLGQYTTYLSKSDFDKSCWRSTKRAALTLCGLVFSHEKILNTDFETTFLEPCKVFDIQSCILTSLDSDPEDILRYCAQKCYSKRKRIKNRQTSKKAR